MSDRPAIKPEIVPIVRDSVEIGRIACWDGLKGDDVGEWAAMTGHSRSVQVIGESGGQGDCFIEGSMDGGDGCVLHSPFGAELKFTGGKSAEVIAEVTQFLRPKVSGVDKPMKVSIMVLL